MPTMTWEEARAEGLRLAGRNRYEVLSHKLPFEASREGWSLTFSNPVNDPDPVFLRDHDGHLLHEWDYVPSLSELDEVCQGLLKETTL